MARKTLTFVEIDVSVCALTYGVSPCAASIGVTGADRCFNSLGTCQDRAHYSESFVTLRFARDTGYQSESNIEAIPSLTEVTTSPGRVSLGEGLGQRSSVTCSFREHPHPDTGEGFDPYHDERAYDPYRQGTFWAKFRARHPNLRGKRLRVIRGYLGQALEDMETRHYIIDSVDGGADGRFSITAKDPLKQLDGDRAVAPRLSSGFLNAGINGSVTSASLTPSGIGNAEYPASGYLNIGGAEIVAFTRSGNTLTLTRGQWGTTGVAHAAGVRVQLCLHVNAKDPAQIIADLSTGYAEIDPTWIPLADWLAETAAYNGQVYTRLIAEPVPVRKLVAELIEQAGLAMGWDDVNQQVRLQVMRAIDTSTMRYDESQYRAGSLRWRTLHDKRLSRVHVYFGQRTPLLPVDNANSYSSSAVVISTDAEANYGSPAIKIIYSPWIPPGGRAIAERLAAVQIGRYERPPIEVDYEVVDAEGTDLPDLLAGHGIAHPTLQLEDGSRAMVPVQVVSLERRDGSIAATAEQVSWSNITPGDPANRIITIDYNTNALNLRSRHDALYGAPYPGGTVTFELTQAALIGSTGVSVPAITTGVWPTISRTGNRTSGSAVITGLASTADLLPNMPVDGTGIPAGTRILSVNSGSQITLTANASSGSGTATALTITVVRIIVQLAADVRGAGGRGGRGARGTGVNAEDGQDGGTALLALVRIWLTITATGRLRSGGGGGGGGGCQTYHDHDGGGGGGAGGVPPGPRGTGPGDAEHGTVGTTTQGRGGGRSWTNWSGLITEGPELENDVRGGRGGDLGSNGNDGYPGFMPRKPGSGGLRGYAIDGLSRVILTNNGTLAGRTTG